MLSILRRESVWGPPCSWPVLSLLIVSSSTLPFFFFSVLLSILPVTFLLLLIFLQYVSVFLYFFICSWRVPSVQAVADKQQWLPMRENSHGCSEGSAMSIRAPFLVVFTYKHSSSLSPLLPLNIFFFPSNATISISPPSWYLTRWCQA